MSNSSTYRYCVGESDDASNDARRDAESAIAAPLIVVDSDAEHDDEITNITRHHHHHRPALMASLTSTNSCSSSSTRRQDESFSEQEDDAFFSSPPSSRRKAVDRPRDRLTTTLFASTTTDKQQGEHHAHYHHHQYRNHPHGTPLLSLHHLTTLIVVTLLLTVATHRYTFSSLRYKLHHFGTYQMRGVPTFRHEYPRSTSISSSHESLSSSSPHALVSSDAAAEEHAPQDFFSFKFPSSTNTVVVHPPLSPTTTSIPLMMPRNFANRHGDNFEIPRGVPLPPPLLALHMNAKLCGVAVSEDECHRNSSSITGSGYHYDHLVMMMDKTTKATSLECVWCTNDNGGLCVPQEMREVMCG